MNETTQPNDAVTSQWRLSARRVCVAAALAVLAGFVPAAIAEEYRVVDPIFFNAWVSIGTSGSDARSNHASVSHGGCSSANTLAISTGGGGGCHQSWGGTLGVGLLSADASSNELALSDTGDAFAVEGIAVSGGGNSTVHRGVAVSGTGSSEAGCWIVTDLSTALACAPTGIAVSGTGPATSSNGLLAVSGAGPATATSECPLTVKGSPLYVGGVIVCGQGFAVSGASPASGSTLAVSGTDAASGGQVAVAGGDADAYGGVMAVSATGNARGGRVLNVGGGGCGC